MTRKWMSGSGVDLSGHGFSRAVSRGELERLQPLRASDSSPSAHSSSSRPALRPVSRVTAGNTPRGWLRSRRSEAAPPAVLLLRFCLAWAVVSGLCSAEGRGWKKHSE